MISRNFSKLSNEDIAGFLIDPDDDLDKNMKVTQSVQSPSDLWILANMNSSI